MFINQKENVIWNIHHNKKRKNTIYCMFPDHMLLQTQMLILTDVLIHAELGSSAHKT